MFRNLQNILEMIRFSHTLFALPFAMLAAVMAWATPASDGSAIEFRWRDLAGIIVCMVAARSAAMAFNRLADRKIDAENPRTKNRHIPAGILSVQSVVVFTLVSSVAFVAATLLFLPNRLPVILAVPVLLFLMGYSYTKRFTSFAHFWLGAALMLAPICAWVAIRGVVVMASPADVVPAVIIGIAVLLWVAGFDMIYACQDYESDVQADLHSVPTALGVNGALRIASVCHLGMIVALAVLPVAANGLGLGWVYWCGVVATAVLLVYEHSLVRADDLTRVNVAFFHVNAIVGIGLFGVVAVDLLTNL